MEFFVFILIIVSFSFFLDVVRDQDDPIWHKDYLSDERRAKAQAHQIAEEQQRRRLNDDHQREILIEFDLMNNFHP